jgi:hypothetical protein
MQHSELYNISIRKINTLNKNKNKNKDINYYLISLILDIITYIKNNIYKELENIKILIKLK